MPTLKGLGLVGGHRRCSEALWMGFIDCHSGSPLLIIAGGCFFSRRNRHDFNLHYSLKQSKAIVIFHE
jgi:hypothetical protein